MKKTALTLAILIVTLCTGTGLYRYQRAHRGPVDYSSLSGTERAKALGALVGELVLLPKGEVPVVATVTNVDLLKDRPLFADAKNGDVVLMYTAEKKAVLYRQSMGKVIDIGPVSIGESQPTVPPVGALTVAIYNGSKIPELAAPVHELISKSFPSVFFLEERNAINSYEKNLVVDVTDKQATLAARMAAFIGAEVTALPPGEETPAADILVIIGK